VLPGWHAGEEDDGREQGQLNHVLQFSAWIKRGTWRDRLGGTNKNLIINVSAAWLIWHGQFFFCRISFPVFLLFSHPANNLGSFTSYNHKVNSIFHLRHVEFQQW